MSYIAFELDALNMVPDVAAAAGATPGEVAHGLLKLWAYCFRGEVDVVTDTHLRGFLGRDMTPALEAFGFLERLEPGLWRVRGAGRYLRVKASRRKGGHAAKANLVPGGGKKKRLPRGQPTGQPSASREAAESEPRLDLGPTPSTEHRAPTTESEALAPAAPPPSARVASDSLCADFRAATGAAYLWAGEKDGTALAALLRAAPLEEVRARWRRGLAATGWKGVRTVAQLRAKWNDLATDGPPRDVTRGFAEPSEWSTEPGSREVAL